MKITASLGEMSHHHAQASDPLFIAYICLMSRTHIHMCHVSQRRDTLIWHVLIHGLHTHTSASTKKIHVRVCNLCAAHVCNSDTMNRATNHADTRDQRECNHAVQVAMRWATSSPLPCRPPSPRRAQYALSVFRTCTHKLHKLKCINLIRMPVWVIERHVILQHLRAPNATRVGVCMLTHQSSVLKRQSSSSKLCVHICTLNV